MTHNERVMQEHDFRDREVPISELQVTGDCQTCFPEARKVGYRVIKEDDVRLISPQGLVHRTEDVSDVTACGKDCTGFGWWHRL